MANLFNQIVRRILPAKRCPACHRTKEQAIAEQVANQEVCPLGHCKFKREIEEAILFSKKPELIEFAVNNLEVIYDSIITFTWDVRNIKNCTLIGVGRVEVSGTHSIPAKTSNTFLLEFEAYNGETYQSEPIEVKVFPAPEIIDFTVSKKEILTGDSVKIEWKTKNIIKTYLIIDGVLNEVDSISEITLNPEKDIEIEIEVIGKLESHVIRKEQIRVYEKACVISFKSDLSHILEYDKVRLFYDAINYSRAQLTGPSINGIKDLTNSKEIEIECVITNNHTTKQTYYLEVFDKLNNPLPKQSIDIIVYPQPQIEYFSISRNKILYGDEIELSWKVRNYNKILLRTDIIETEVTPLSSYKIKPQNTGKYKLIVESLGALKNIESAEQSLEVFYYVELEFSSDKNHTIQTVPVNLKWNVRHATEVYLEVRENSLSSVYSNRINVTNRNSFKVVPEKTSIYRIIASNELDKVEEEKQISVFELPKVDSFKLPHIPMINFNQEVSLNFDNPKRFVKIEKTLEDNNWYYQLFTWQPRDIGNWMLHQFESLNKRILTLINTLK